MQVIRPSTGRLRQLPCFGSRAMETFRQRKSARLSNKSPRGLPESLKIAPRGLDNAAGEATSPAGRTQGVVSALSNGESLTQDPERLDLHFLNGRGQRKRVNAKKRLSVSAVKDPGVNEGVEVSEDVPQAVPGKIVNAKQHRVARKPAAKPAQKPPKLPAGAPATELSVWTPEKMAAAVKHLQACDPKIAALASEYGETDKLYPKGTQNMFASLARSIAGQQLATQAAFKIHSRFVEACKRAPDDPVQPSDVLATSHETLRGCGFSGMKANYIRDLATHFDGGLLSDEAIAVMDDETLITELTKVKGIGRWSVDMFAMFHLGRMDVLPVGDLGVRNGMKMLYGLSEPPKADQMEVLTEAWRPFRSLGSYYMWGLMAKKTSLAPKKAKSSKKVASTPTDKVPM